MLDTVRHSTHVVMSRLLLTRVDASCLPVLLAVASHRLVALLAVAHSSPVVVSVVVVSVSIQAQQHVVVVCDV